MYGDSAQGNQRGGAYNSVQFANEGAKQGQYDNANRYNKDRGNRQNYNRNIYYDDREEAGRRHLANDYGAGNRYAEDQYRERPHYQPNYQDSYYDRPINNRKHITIYEDPRYARRAPYKQYDDDYVELEVRPRLDYRNKRRPHDYYYWNCVLMIMSFIYLVFYKIIFYLLMNKKRIPSISICFQS